MGDPTLAGIVAPFGRLPAGAVHALAVRLLEALEREHARGNAGIDLQLSSLSIAGDWLVARPGQSPYWLLPPERARGESLTARSDLFSAGALLLELLVGRRVLDAGDAPSTGALLAGMRAPPPVAALCPTVPAPLERLLLALLQPDIDKRPQDAAAAGALISAAKLDIPAVLVALAGVDPRAACAQLQQAHAASELSRAKRLLADPTKRRAAAVALLRSNALVPGQPEVTTLLGHAAANRIIRAPGAPQAPELATILTRITAAEPTPPPALIAAAARALNESGDLLEALAMMKRAPDDADLRRRVDDLAGPRDDADAWQAGGSWVLPTGTAAAAASPSSTSAHPATSAHAPTEQQVGAPGSPGTPWAPPMVVFDGPPVAGGLKRVLLDLLTSMSSRQRLALAILVASAVMGSAVMFAFRLSTNEESKRLAQIERLAAAANDCGPGGAATLLVALRAAELGETGVVDELVGKNDARIPMGTRCHQYAMGLSAKATKGREK